MSTTEAELSINSISKMKVAELKKELKARGLSTAGAKNELQERLQQAIQGVAQDLVSEDGNAESEILDEDEVLGDEEEGGEFDDEEADAVLEDEPKSEPVVTAPLSTATKRPAPLATEPSQEVQPKKRILVRPMSIGKENGGEEKSSSEQSAQESKEAEEKKVIKIAGVPVKERLEMRAQKFGVPLSEQAKKEARAARFGVAPATQSSTNVISTKIGTNTKINFEGPSADVLKKRAERFGCNVSTLAVKLEQQEKLKKRQERFGLTSSPPSSTLSSAKTSISTVTTKTPISIGSFDEKKKQRAERFKI